MNYLDQAMYLIHQMCTYTPPPVKTAQQLRQEAEDRRRADNFRRIYGDLIGRGVVYGYMGLDLRMMMPASGIISFGELEPSKPASPPARKHRRNV